MTDNITKDKEVLPSSADRILAMAEKQSLHGQNMENKAISEGLKASKRGQFSGFVVAILVICLGFWLFMAGKDGYGFAVIVTEVASLVGLFIYNRVSEKKELSDKKGKNNV